MTEPDTAPEDVTLDKLFSCLSDTTRRRILTTLAEHNPRAESELESPRFHPQDEEMDVSKATLQHNHLPQLASAGFIEWDRESDTVTRGPNFETVRPLIELVNDHHDELPEDWP